MHVLLAERSRQVIVISHVAIMASHYIPYFNGSSGSLTMFTAIRRASSRVSSVAADR